MGTQSRINPSRLARSFLILGLFASVRLPAQQPLLSPAGLAFDGAGVLYVADSGRHIVERFDPAQGAFVVVAGNQTQGFRGDGGLATAAELDSPQGIALDAEGNLYIADSHNQRIRRVSGATGIISTVAGSGAAGFSGDGGTAIAASLRQAAAIAFDPRGNLLIADTGNHRIRRVVLATGLISTVAGNGTEGSSGDGGPATMAALDMPGGLAVDSVGDIYIADTHNHRVRMVSASTGIISSLAGALGLPKGLSVDGTGNIVVADPQGHTIVRLGGGAVTVIAGTGVEGFAGDGGPATSALLDGPRTAGISPQGLVTLADTRNQRVRQIDSAGTIRTFSGSSTVTVAWSSPSTFTYGTGDATISVNGATGTITLNDISSGVSVTVGTGVLSGGSTDVSLAGLSAGTHRLVASYAGDTLHPSGQSAIVTVNVTPASLTAAADAIAAVFGAEIPPITGVLIGVLPRDTGFVSAIFTSPAALLSPTGDYPVLATLSGPAAGNYTVVTTGVVSIVKAGTATQVSTSTASVSPGTPLTLSATVVPTAKGAPTGKLNFLDGGVSIASSLVDAHGSGSVAVTLGTGTHAVSAVYSGDTNFLGSTSPTISEVVTALPPPPDFVLNATGGSTQTVSGGSTAVFGFGVTEPNGNLSGPIALSVSGLPAGATASFNPALIPPGGTVTSFLLSIQTVKPATVSPVSSSIALFCLGMGFARRRNRRVRAGGLLLMLSLLAGCGDRIATLTGSGSSGAPVSYPLTVTGTSTAANGTVLQHSVTVTLTVQ